MSLTTDRADGLLAPNRAGRPQGLLLMLISCLPILGAVLLAPILPDMRDAFGNTDQAEAMVPLALTLPALMIALLAPFAGRIIDAFGRKRLLVTALVVYSALGTAPLWLDGLPEILMSRAGVGIAEAAIMTCCTTMIADYFSGPERDRWLGLQTVFASVSATLFFALGGALGAHSWRTPFWLYACGLVFAVLAAALLWQPQTPVKTRGEHAALAPLPWSRLLLPCGATLLGGIVFYTPIVQVPFLLDDLGIDTVPIIGAVTAAASAATAAGAFTFGRVAGRRTPVLLAVAFGLAGVGLVVAGFAGSVPTLVIGAIVASAGTGLMLPTLLTWALSGVAFEQRGRATGRWTAALFLGEFVCPLLVIALMAGVDDRGVAVAMLGLISLVAAATALLGAGRSVRALSASSLTGC